MSVSYSLILTISKINCGKFKKTEILFGSSE